MWGTAQLSWKPSLRTQSQQQLLRWGFNAQMISVGWVLGEDFVEEVNLSYSRKGSWNSSKMEGSFRTVNWIPLAALLIRQSSKRSLNRKSVTVPRDDSLRQPCPRSALRMGPRGSLFNVPTVDSSQSPKCQNPAEKVISTFYFLAHRRNSISYQNHVFPHNSQIRFLTKWFEETPTQKKYIKPVKSFSSGHLNLESMLLKGNNSFPCFYALCN